MASGVFTENSQDLSLNCDVGSGGVDGCHLGVGGLEPDHAAFAIKALQGGVGAVDQCDHDFSLASGASSLDEDVIAGDDVFIAHGVASHFEREDLSVSDDISERDGFGGFNGFDGASGGDASKKREAFKAFFAGSRRQYVDRAASVVGALQQTLVLEIRDVFVDCGEGVEAQTGCDLLIGRGVSVLLGEPG